jgi:hypothetical protein
VELFRVTYWSRTPDGKLWCESSDADEVVRLSVGHGCTYGKTAVYLESRQEPWAPLECVNAQCAKHYGGPRDWDCKAVNPSGKIN